jgi:hypothetical protein
LQLFDIIRGWAVFYFSSVIGHGGCSCRQNHESKNFQRGGCKNTFLKVNGETISG